MNGSTSQSPTIVFRTATIIMGSLLVISTLSIGSEGTNNRLDNVISPISNALFSTSTISQPAIGTNSDLMKSNDPTTNPPPPPRP